MKCDGHLGSMCAGKGLQTRVDLETVCGLVRAAYVYHVAYSGRVGELRCITGTAW